jgi:hypothetical protein
MMEQATRRLLYGNHAWLVDHTTKRKFPFRPHVTAQKTGRVQYGDHFTVGTVSLVEQKGDHKEVVGEVRLSG